MRQTSPDQPSRGFALGQGTASVICRYLLRLLFRCLVFFVLLAVLLYAPLNRYRPACNREDRNEIEFTGPMRDAYVGQLSEILEEEGVPHIRIGNEILSRFVDDPFSFAFPFSRSWPHNILINMEWLVAGNVSHGYGPGGSRIEPPPMLAALMEKHRAVFSRNFPEKDWTSPGYS